MKPATMAHESRPRTNDEDRAHLIGLGVPDDIAMTMLNQIGIMSVVNLSELELAEFGVPRKAIRRMRAASALMRHAASPELVSISNAEDLYDLLRPMIAYEEQEEFVSIGLDVRNQLLGIVRVARGRVDAVEVHPREVFRAAIRMNAAAIVVGHNHPSNDATPSDADIELTRRLRSAGELLGIPLIDHVIVTRRGFRSIARDFAELEIKRGG